MCKTSSEELEKVTGDEERKVGVEERKVGVKQSVFMNS